MAAAGLLSLAAAEEKKPNVLFIISDDHAVQALGSCDKDSPIPLPGFRKLAEEGMTFDRAYCTNSICGPSRASILTGRHSHRNGFIYNYNGPIFDGSQPTYPKMLQKAGYQTGLIGKWHLKSNPTGFDTWQVFPDQGDYWNPTFVTPKEGGGTHHHKERGYVSDILTTKAIDWMENRDKTKPFALVLGHKAPHRNWIPAPRHLAGIRELVAKMTPPPTLHDDWKNRPAFLSDNRQSVAWDLCSWNDSHLVASEIPFEVMKDIVPKAQLRQRVNSGQLKAPEGFDWAAHEPRFATKTNLSFDATKAAEPGLNDLYATFYKERTRAFVKEMLAGEIKTQEDMTLRRWRWYMEDYLGCVQAVDESIADLMKYLDIKGLSEDTLVIYVGDQSFYLGEHGLYDKRWIFEESFRMPLIMRWKGHITPDVRSQALVQGIDYAPTICAVTGTDTPENMGSFDGVSLQPLFETGANKAFDGRALYYAFYEQPAEHNAPRHDGMRTDRYTFSRIWTPTPAEKASGKRALQAEWMLIDNEKDPLQMRNVVAEPEYAETVKELRARYEQLRRDFKVPADSPGSEVAPPALKVNWD